MEERDEGAGDREEEQLEAREEGAGDWGEGSKEGGNSRRKKRAAIGREEERAGDRGAQQYERVMREQETEENSNWERGKREQDIKKRSNWE